MLANMRFFFRIVQRRVRRDGSNIIISSSPIILIKSLNLNLEFVCACSNYLLWLCNWVIWVLIFSFLPFWTSITAIISIEIKRIFCGYLQKHMLNLVTNILKARILFCCTNWLGNKWNGQKLIVCLPKGKNEFSSKK